MPRNWSFEIGLFSAVCLAMAVLSYSFRGVASLPTLPLNRAFERGESHGGWKELFGESIDSGSVPRTAVKSSLRVSEEGVEIVSGFEEVKGGAELVFADENGHFEGSWCRGRLGFASLVLPQMNSKGRLLAKWTIPYYDIEGKPVTEATKAALTKSLIDSPYLNGGSSQPHLVFEVKREASPAVVGLLQVETSDLEWEAADFSSFDAGNHFGSQSSHGLRVGDGVMGQAEMFTWHRAPIRLSWDLQGKGESLSDEIPVEDGAAFRRGGLEIKVLGVIAGAFQAPSKGKPGEPVIYRRREASTPVRTCFLSGNLPGKAVARVEAKGGDGIWREATFAAEESGIVAVVLGGDSGDAANSATLLRVVWRAGLMRVVVDVPGIGGYLPENEGVTTYNEIRFPLEGAVFDNQGMSWRLWQLLGSYPRINGDRFDAARSPGTRAVPGRLYRAEDLYKTWQRMNPDLKFRFDANLNAIVIDDR